jgi:dimethylhistidine N-methyltransferase
MHRAPHSRRFAWIEESASTRRDSFAHAVEDGLSGEPLSLPCRFFYDAIGSELFEAICELPEYYLTRAEHEILTCHADEIAARCAMPVFLAELGSGSATKTRLLIEAFLRRQGGLRYVPIDISQSALDASVQSLLADYRGLEITAIASEYREGLHHLGKDTRLPKLVAWLGSNIGNFPRADAHHFVSGIRDAMGADDRLLLGVDLRKDTRALEQAYDDAQGVTARFNKNLLARINRELGGSFDLADWRHRARVVDDGGRVEIGLVCERDCEVAIAALGRRYRFARGDFIHTEDSTKYSEREIAELAAAASLRVDAHWLDARRRFCAVLLAPR